MAKEQKQKQARPGRPVGSTVTKATYKVDDLLKVAPNVKLNLRIQVTAEQMKQLGIAEFRASNSEMANAIAKALQS